MGPGSTPGGGTKNAGQHNGMHQVSKTSDGKSSTLLACANMVIVAQW